MSFLTPPPKQAVLLRQPFEVSLRLSSEGGMALPGRQVRRLPRSQRLPRIVCISRISQWTHLTQPTINHPCHSLEHPSDLDRISSAQVQAIVLAPIGSGVRLAPGAYGYTDEAGVATFSISVDSGQAGDYLLLFGSAGTMQVCHISYAASPSSSVVCPPLNLPPCHHLPRYLIARLASHHSPL